MTFLAEPHDLQRLRVVRMMGVKSFGFDAAFEAKSRPDNESGFERIMKDFVSPLVRAKSLFIAQIIFPYSDFSRSPLFLFGQWSSWMMNIRRVSLSILLGIYLVFASVIISPPPSVHLLFMAFIVAAISCPAKLTLLFGNHMDNYNITKESEG